MHRFVVHSSKRHDSALEKIQSEKEIAPRLTLQVFSSKQIRSFLLSRKHKPTEKNSTLWSTTNMAVSSALVVGRGPG